MGMMNGSLPLPPKPTSKPSWSKTLLEYRTNPEKHSGQILPGIHYPFRIEVLEGTMDNIASVASPAKTVTTPAPVPVPVAAPVSAAVSTPAPVPIATPATALTAGEQILSPMPGTILTIDVQPGQPVKCGAVLLCFEAMKMENEIVAPRDGVVASVHVQKGSTIDTGTLLCVLS